MSSYKIEQKRLLIWRSIPLADALVSELLSFRVTTDDRTHHDSYDAQSGAHDDLVLALCIATWYAERANRRARATTDFPVIRW